MTRVDWQKTFTNLDKKSYVGQEIYTRVQYLEKISSRHIKPKEWEEIQKKFIPFRKRNKVREEFKNRKLNEYYENILQGDSIEEKLGGSGLKQRQRIAFLTATYMYSEYLSCS